MTLFNRNGTIVRLKVIFSPLTDDGSLSTCQNRKIYAPKNNNRDPYIEYFFLSIYPAEKPAMPGCIMLRQHFCNTLTAAILLLLLSGCTMLGPDFTTPETQTPETWITADDPLFKKSSPQESQEWWSTYHDPVLDRLIGLAVEQNLSLRSATLRILEARAQLAQVQGYLFPQAQQASGELATFGSPGTSSTQHYNGASIGFDVGWEMDFWGKYRRSIESADANLAADMADYEDILVSLTAEVAQTYISICTLEERIRLARRNSTIQEKGLRLVQEQLDAGTVTRLDLLQAQTLLNSTRSVIPNLQSARRTTRNGLAVLLGMLPAELDKILPESKKIPESEPDTAVGAPAEMLRRRPDVRRAEMKVAAQSAQIGIARADLFPSFTLFGSLSWSATDAGSNSLGDIFDSNSISYGFGPSFSWNLFNYGRLKNQVRIQDARLQQLITSYQNSVLSAAREVEDAMNSIMYAYREIVLINKTIISSRESLELASLQYEEGFVDYQRVLDSTRSLTQKEDQYAQLLGKIEGDVITLYKAMGGGWSTDRVNPSLPESVQKEMSSRTDWGTLLEQDTRTEETD